MKTEELYGIKYEPRTDYDGGEDMAFFMKHRFDDEVEEYILEDVRDDDETLEEIEEREYWANVLSQEMR